MGLFGGTNTDVSSAQGQSQSAINSSGWTVGGGSSSGGSLSASSGAKLPWYALVSILAVGAAWYRYRVKK